MTETSTANDVTLDPTLSALLGPSFAIAPMGTETPEEAAVGNKRRQRFASAMHFVGGFALAFGVKTALTLALASTPPLLMAVIMASTGSALGGLWEARQLAKKEGISFREAMKSKKANKAAGFSLLGAVTFGVADHFLHVGQHLTQLLHKIELKLPSMPGISFADAAQPKADSLVLGRASMGPFDTGIKPIVYPQAPLPQFSMVPTPSVAEAFAAPAGGLPYAAPTSTPLMSTPYNFAELPSSGGRVSMVFPAPAAEVAAAQAVVAAPVSAPVPPAAPVSALAPVPEPIDVVSPAPVVPVEASSAPAVAAIPELPVAEPAKPVLDCVVREQMTSNTGEWPSYMTAGRAPEPTTLHPVCKAFKEVVQSGDLLRGTVLAPNADGQLTAYTYEATANRTQSISDIVPKWINSIVSRTYGIGSIAR